MRTFDFWIGAQNENPLSKIHLMIFQFLKSADLVPQWFAYPDCLQQSSGLSESQEARLI